MINNNIVKQDKNLTTDSILQCVRIFGAENLIKSDINNNNSITIPDKNNYCPRGYY